MSSEFHGHGLAFAGDLVRRGRLQFERHARARRLLLDLNRHVRHDDAADDDQARRPADFDARAERSRERDRNEVERHLIRAVAVPRDGTGERDDAAVDLREVLTGNQQDPLAVRVDREAADDRVLGGRQLEDGRQIVERDDLDAAGHPRRERPLVLRGDDRVGRRRLALEPSRQRGEQQRGEPDREGDPDAHDGWGVRRTQWLIITSDQ